MVKIIPSKDRYFQDFGWLKTYWLFSFANYFDPDNIQFGALRVFNDDLIEPGQGFPTHPHNEMEIVTIVLEGEITHKDSMGNSTVIRAGEVQRMSAGTGITHSEFNLGRKNLTLYQVWIIPNRSGLTPSYDQKKFPPELWKNKLFPLVSGRDSEGSVSMHADAEIYRGGLDAGESLQFKPGEQGKVFIYVSSGEITINGSKLYAKDQLRIEDEDNIHFCADTDTDFILIELH